MRRAPTIAPRFVSHALALVLSAPAGCVVHAQARGWEDREYGIGVVKYAAMGGYAVKDVILASPSHSPTRLRRSMALLFASERLAGAFARTNRMIEFAYEIPGWAILTFSPDSAWVQVTLHPSEPPGLLGWVKLRPDSVEPLLGSQVLPQHRLFFLRPSDIAFYSAPVGSSRVSRQLAEYPRSRRLNYIMKPMEVRGNWLRVELFSPSTMCVFPEPKVTPDTLWIQYLAPDRRPKVFYYTRGC